MKKIGYLLIAILGNALGTAIMEASNIGMSAWGSSSLNTAAFFNLELWAGFVILSFMFYFIAVIIRKKFIISEFIRSFLFMIGFSIFTSLFMNIVPDLEYLSYITRAMINIVGLCILMFGIAVHLKVNFAVHPMDVYLHVIQKKLGVLKGTYFSYFSGFSVAIIFGLINGEILGIGLGTAFTLLLSGLIMKFYNSLVLCHWKFE